MTTFQGRLEARLARTVDRVARGARERGELPTIDLALIPQVRLPWYTIRNEAAEGNAPAEPPTVFIYDEIGGSYGVDAKTFAADLLEIDAPLIKVRINSPGGSLFDGRAIFNSLNHHPARIAVYVDSIAASAASLIAMAGDEIVIMPGAELMIHDAAMPIEGNADDLTKGAVFLNRESEGAADIYRQRAGGTTEEWRARMKAETWLFGPEAVELGLATRYEELETPADPDPVMQERMIRRHDLTRFGYRGRRQPVRQHRATTTERGSNAMDRTEPTPSADLATAAQHRGEASERRAHLLAQEGRSVPVLRTSDRFQTQMRVVRTEMPPGVGAARLQSFRSKMQHVGMVSRGGRDLTHVAGYASMYGAANRYLMYDDHGPYFEDVAPMAGARSLAGQPDVAFLMNHQGVTMARTKPGTLELAEDESGLADDAYVNPERADVTLLLQALDDESIDEQSFAFMIDEGRWSEDFSAFTIVRYDIDRGDVSAVNYGANPHTSIAARSQQILADVDRMPIGLARAAADRLSRRTDVRERRDTYIEVNEAGEVDDVPCPSCGAMNADDAKFCDQCGAPMGAAAAEPMPADKARAGRSDRLVVTGRRITAIEALLDDD